MEWGWLTDFIGYSCCQGRAPAVAYQRAHTRHRASAPYASSSWLSHGRRSYLYVKGFEGGCRHPAGADVATSTGAKARSSARVIGKRLSGIYPRWKPDACECLVVAGGRHAGEDMASHSSLPLKSFGVQESNSSCENCERTPDGSSEWLQCNVSSRPPGHGWPTATSLGLPISVDDLE